MKERKKSNVLFQAHRDSANPNTTPSKQQIMLPPTEIRYTKFFKTFPQLITRNFWVLWQKMLLLVVILKTAILTLKLNCLDYCQSLLVI
jgi:hypothetical protein